ncbi:GNAT family N-acetyltransferase [candidate division KSB1 bacterium]|nr:GNAT family N-acetyltransferase [candidate division KSB1 bacterium]NIR72516.1 GNAT family N-acetyltransferase [candidate division KSB1 bacterium]NIS23624.1 GNAT family N-acetyltransferase [candidate division KSB1 bacterium]NIT70550.1 GNAT family N-acetyltransferase [candidate division KSB1 bacterium]NIU24257.1 GNAT family N-acetyltransferase [candidate division KSB1 bacterium]
MQVAFDTLKESLRAQAGMKRASFELQLEEMNPLAISNWNEHILSTPRPSIFHTQNWLRVLKESYGYRPYYLAYFEKGRLVVLMPIMEIRSWITGTRGVSLPFSDYCEPIIAEKACFPELFDNVVGMARQCKWKFIEIRGGDEWLRSAVPWSWYYRHILSLKGDESEIFGRLRSNYRAKIRKALRNDVKTEILQTPEAMTEYYRLHCLTRKGHGLPPQPILFFKKIYEHIVSQNLGFVLLASHREKYLSGAVFFRFGKRAIYKFGAADMRYQHLNPNYLVFWNAIQWLYRNGCNELCFGKSAPGNQGLIQFKDGWGTEKYRINYFRYELKTASFAQNANQSMEAGYHIFRKMPVSLLKMAGTLLYPHVG